MKQVTKDFLTILKDARFNSKTNIIIEDFDTLYKLSNEHQVSALVYNQIYQQDNLSSVLRKQWSLETIKINASQMIKTQRFLHVYKRFLDANVKVVVVKGLICRSLYPVPDNRPSNDEDLYIQRCDLKTVSSIFIEEGFQKISEEEDEVKFLDYKSGLSIELHLALFSKKSNAYGRYQSIFKDTFNFLTIHQIENIRVYSLSHNQHLLFLILHFTKHFLHGGVGIRQLMDIIMYIETFSDKLNWKTIFNNLETLGLVTFVLNIFEICHQYLSFDYKYVNLGNYQRIENEYEDLLEDIMESGIFGQTSNERIHSSTITLNAMEKGKVNVLRSVFPSLESMKGKYEYLNDKPYLLPVAQASRILNYLKHSDSKESKKTVDLGNQRVNLLKKYKIMDDSVR